MVASNSGAPRSAQISVAGIAVTVAQASSVLVVSTGGVVNAAGYTAPVAPGSIASIFGNFLLAAPVSVSSFPIPTSLGGLSLQFGGAAFAPLFYANPGQANAQVPWELSGQSQTTIVATINGQTSAPQTVNLAAYAPGIFATNGAGTGQGAIVDADYHLVDATNPATAGSTVVQIYCTGLGPVTDQPATGAPALSTPLSLTTTQPNVSIGGAAATVSFSGLTPGYAGLYQVNAQVPQASARGNAVPVVIVYRRGGLEYGDDCSEVVSYSPTPGLRGSVGNALAAHSALGELRGYDHHAVRAVLLLPARNAKAGGWPDPARNGLLGSVPGLRTQCRLVTRMKPFEPSRPRMTPKSQCTITHLRN